MRSLFRPKLRECQGSNALWHAGDSDSEGANKAITSQDLCCAGASKQPRAYEHTHTPLQITSQPAVAAPARVCPTWACSSSCAAAATNSWRQHSGAARCGAGAVSGGGSPQAAAALVAVLCTPCARAARPSLNARTVSCSDACMRALCLRACVCLRVCQCVCACLVLSRLCVFARSSVRVCVKYLCARAYVYQIMYVCARCRVCHGMKRLHPACTHACECTVIYACNHLRACTSVSVPIKVRLCVRMPAIGSTRAVFLFDTRHILHIRHIVNA